MDLKKTLKRTQQKIVSVNSKILIDCLTAEHDAVLEALATAGEDASEETRRVIRRVYDVVLARRGALQVVDQSSDPDEDSQ